jgi:hypothetical protein
VMMNAVLGDAKDKFLIRATVPVDLEQVGD